jgi:hypothetical protein
MIWFFLNWIQFAIILIVSCVILYHLLYTDLIENNLNKITKRLFGKKLTIRV